MTVNLGDLLEDSNVNFFFTTNNGSGGRVQFDVPAGTGSLEAADITIYKDGEAMTLDAGSITIIHDFDSKTGLHKVTVDMSVDADFTKGSDYAAVLYPDLETVDSQNVVAVLAYWSCENRPVDATRISGDATAADNLESMYDGTGYTANTAPASRQQVDGIGAASGGSLNFANEADNVDSAIKSISFDGVETSGTNASVNFEDGTYHQIDDNANNIDIVYQFDVGGGRTAVELTWKGRLVGTNDEFTIQAYNGSGWDTLKTITGQSNSAPTGSSDNSTETIPLLSTHTGTSSDLGKVFIRLECASQSNPTLYTDQLLIAAVNIGQSIGYANGSIWIDTIHGTAGTENFVNGTADNPVSTWADALTLSASLGINRFTIAAGSTITLTADSSEYEIMGNNYALAFNGQDVTGSKINGATVSGTYVGTTAILEDCIINAITGPGITMRRCFYNEVTITNNAGNAWYLNDCRSRVAGMGSAKFDFGSGLTGTPAGETTEVSMRAYSGGIEILNMAPGDMLSLEGDGALTVNENCTGGIIAVRGNIRINDNSAGAPTFNITPDVTGYQEGAVWCDESNGTSSGSVVGIDGTFQNQSNDFDNAQDIADSLGTERIIIRPGTSITLSDSLQGYQIHNVQATINGGSQDIDSTRIDGGFLTGTFTRAGTGVPTFVTCNLNNVTSDRVACLANCGILGTFTMAEAGVYVFNDAQAAGATGVAILDFANLGGATASFQRWSGDLTVNNMASGDELKLHCTSGDDIVLNGASGATVTISGVVGTVTSSGFSGTLNDNAIHLANINAEADTALSDYDAPTKTELDAGFAALNDVSQSDITGGAYSLDTDANGRIRIVDGTGAGELDTNSGLIAGIAGTKNTLDDLNDLSAVDVNSEVVDALNTDTYAEPGQENPGATVSLATKINYLYKAWRNKKTQTATTFSLFNDAGTTVDQKSTVSDDGTATIEEMVTGP